MNLPIMIIGAGGHTKVLIDALRLRSIQILGITDSDPAKLGAEILGVRVIGDDNVILSRHDSKSLYLLNGLGSTDLPVQRKAVYLFFKDKGFTFATIIHPSATVASDVTIGEGMQIMAGAVVQPGCKLGVNSIVNTNASIDHDCHLGDHVHIAPGATLCGSVITGDTVHIGSGSTIIQGIVLGSNCLIGAGALVLKDVGDNTSVRGNPAREVTS